MASDAADFPNYYFGGERLRGGEPVYDSLESEIEEMFGVVGYDTYPADSPATVVLFTPLSLFAYDTAWMIWQAISAVLVVVSIVIVAREVGYSAPVATAAAALAFLTTPVRFLLERNHMEGLLLLCGVVGWRHLRRGAERRGSVWWGVATALKFFPGLWLVGLADRRLRRHMATGLAVAVGLVTAGGLVLGLTNVEQFLTETLPGARQWHGTLGNYSLLSVGSALVAPWFGWLLVGLAMVVLMPRYFARPSGPDRTFVLGTAVALLISPLAWLNYFILAIPAMIILSCYLDLSGNARHRVGYASLLVGLLGWGPIVTGSEVVTEFTSFVPTYALITLFVVAHQNIRRRDGRRHR